MGAEKNQELTLKCFFWGKNLPLTFAKRRRLIEQMGRSETSWGRNMLPCPSGEKSCFVKTVPWGCKYPYSATLISRLFRFWVKWAPVTVSVARSFLKSSRDTQHDQWTSTLGTLVVTQDDPKHNVGTSFHKSAYNTASNATHFSPLL